MFGCYIISFLFFYLFKFHKHLMLYGHATMSIEMQNNILHVVVNKLNNNIILNAIISFLDSIGNEIRKIFIFNM